MGMLSLKRLMGRQRQREWRRRRQKAQKPRADGSIASERKGNNYQCGKRLRYSWPNFPEDIWSHIHSLMPLRDASRAACVSRAFLRSWRCHPNLIFSKRTLGLEQNACRKSDISRAFTCIVDHILTNHSGNGIKTLNLDIFDCPNLNTCDLNNWLQNAIKPGIEEITLVLPLKHRKVYSFPCSLLFGGSGRSLRYLDINGCSLVGLCLRSLTKLRLCQVLITGDELGCLLANTFALKELELMKCSEIICLKVPLLKQLSYLNVFACNMLQMIEIKALNLSTFNFTGSTVQFSLGQLLRVKYLNMTCLKKFDVLCYVITKLPYVVPNVETLVVSSITERVDAPMVTAKFLHLKYLSIELAPACSISPECDYLSLVYFLDASPVLETFILREYMEHCSVFDDASPMRLMAEHKKHKNLKNVTMIGFCSAKSMVELTCHILESTTSLECITLDTIVSWYENEEDIIDRCCVRGTRRRECLSIGTEMILEAHRAILAIERYILGKVPAAVRLDVHRPCTRCHTV
ncbi:hypothetical protein OsI_11652 [Oryza sativa Indica Group]|uniref:Uncharacterized protein n=1 Tax=Oryza sativa subsp. indica TaxID=39946 RepID=A2XGX3_ORYSI|nr:hypothetical protein OsI_11652 [Oryza sativa Indica Group]